MKQHMFDGAFLKFMRERNKLTLQELANSVGSSKSHMHELESGRKTEPSFSMVYRMSITLGCDMRLFACEVEK